MVVAKESYACINYITLFLQELLHQRIGFCTKVIYYAPKSGSSLNCIVFSSVIDPFLGSGSTLIACEETDRVCRGIELDPKFVDVILKRYIEHSEGRYEDVYVIRDGQKLKFDEVATFEPESVDAG